MRGEPLNYLDLSNGRLLGLLRRMECNGRLYRKFLPMYPQVCCEPLESFYLCRKNTNAFDLHLLQDFLFAYSWREANWGAWIAALAPKPEYVDHLRLRRSTLPHGTWVIDLALAACGEALPHELKDHHRLWQSIMSMLDELPSAHVPLRLEPGPEIQEQWREEAALLKSAYREGGLPAANERMKQGLLGYYAMDHAEWQRKGAAPVPLRKRQIWSWNWLQKLTGQ